MMAPPSSLKIQLRSDFTLAVCIIQMIGANEEEMSRLQQEKVAMLKVQQA